MKTNYVFIMIVVFVGILSGLGLLVSINSAYEANTMPVFERIVQVQKTQAELKKQISGLDKKFDQLEGNLKEFAKAMAARGPQMPPQPPPEDMDKVHDVPVGNSPVIGKKDAAVTIVAFEDLQCPFCARFYPPLKQILQAYPDKVRLVIKNFPLPFHPNAKPAAKVALASNEQGKYGEMIEMLMENGADVSDDKLKEYSKKIGIKYDQLKNDLKNNDAKYEDQIADDMKLVETAEVRGTPTFLINGKKTMARDFDGYKAAIDKILSAQ